MTLEDVTLAVGQGQRVYIIAPTYQEAEQWRRINLPLLNPRLLPILVTRPEMLMGTMNPRYVVVNGYPRGNHGIDAREIALQLEITGAVCLGHFYY